MTTRDSGDKDEKAMFWEQMQEDYDRLRADPEAWRDYQNDMALWDSTSNDALESEEPYYIDDEVDAPRS